MTTAAYAPTMPQSNPEEVLQAIRTIVAARHPVLQQLQQLQQAGYGQAQPQFGYGQAQPQFGYGMAQQSNPEEVLQAIRMIVAARHPLLQQLGYGQAPQQAFGFGPWAPQQAAPQFGVYGS